MQSESLGEPNKSYPIDLCVLSSNSRAAVILASTKVYACILKPK